MFKKTILALSLALFVFAATVVVADAATGGVKKLQDNLTGFGSDTGLGDDADLKTKIASIVNIVLGFVGLLSTIIIIYAGFRWMTASGNEEQIKEAKGNIRNAVIGIVVVLLSFTIINFVVNRVSEETGAGGGGGGDGGGTQLGVGACIFVDDDSGTPGDGVVGTCNTFSTCHDGQTQSACDDLQGQKDLFGPINGSCNPLIYKPSETCEENNFTPGGGSQP